MPMKMNVQINDVYLLCVYCDHLLLIGKWNTKGSFPLVKQR